MGDSPFREQITESVSSLVATDEFRRWVAACRNPADEDLIVLNNSFIERQGIPSTKNSQYLCVEQGELVLLNAGGIRVCQPASFNVDFKRCSASGVVPVTESLSEAVERNLPAVGQLIFLLIGELDETVSVEVEVKHPTFDALRFVPTNDELVAIDGKAIEVRSLRDPGAVWSALEACCERSGSTSDDVLAGFDTKFNSALETLRGQAHSLVHLPRERLEAADGTLIRRIVGSLRDEIANYDHALKKCEGDPGRDAQSFSDVLRIAYNFASDSSKLINLIVSICDLKPLLLWATIAEHFELAMAFGSLPWARGTNKASISRYRDMVNGARNHAFHDLIRLDRSVIVEVGSVALQARSLKLFAPYSKKSGNTLEYEDQELVEILTQFTHAPETVVPPEFWRRNSRVMHALADVFAATERALVLLHNELVQAGTGSSPRLQG